MAFAGDPSSYVRQALVDLLARAPHSEHREVLLRLAADEWSNADAFYEEEPSRSIARRAILALAEYSLTSSEGSRLVDIALDTPDSVVRALAPSVAADASTAQVRSRLWAIGIEPIPRWVRVDAIHGLSVARVVEPALVAEVTVSVLLRQPAVVAAAATCLLARHAEAEVVFNTIEAVAQSNKRRALLLIAATLLDERGRRDVADRLLRLLPADHPARNVLGLSDGDELPNGALDDLGSVRVRKAVTDWLGDRFKR